MKMNRILIIRGGALGDFILTLPALHALREANAAARIEILGYKHIAVLAEGRFYANAVRSIEYGALSGFFATNAELDQELSAYFRSFDLIVSYLFDPDEIFDGNLSKAGAGRIITGPGKLGSHMHASRQLAQPVQQLGIEVSDFRARLYLSAEDRAFGEQFVANAKSDLLTLHPGSGSEQKNWPIEHWLEVGEFLLGRGCSLVIVAGEADQHQLKTLQHAWPDRDVLFAINLPLPELAAVLARSNFLGHDSGIAHLAAAVGAQCVVLFGPTDPRVWAPQGSNVRVIEAPAKDLKQLDTSTVLESLLPSDV
jgi:heptosyltransferase-2